MTVTKLVRDGKVAVLVSHGFGAGWSSWNSDHRDFCLYDAGLVQLVEDKAGTKAIEKYVDGLFGEDNDFYFGGADTLSIEWVEQGKPFYLHEYDGSEWIVTDFDVA